MSLNDKAAAALKREIRRAFPERPEGDAGHDRLAKALSDTARPIVWCATHCDSPRKHAHPEPTSKPTMSVTLGNSQDDRDINLRWTSGDIHSQIVINVAMLRAMLELAESYKPGATLRDAVLGGFPARAEGGAV